MAQDRTSGFDMLIQISESEINTQLATAFLAGTIIPTTMSVPVNSNGISGTANLNFNTPTADLDRPRPRMGVTIPFVNSQLQITSPLPLNVAPLGGTIVIEDTIEVNNDGSNAIATMDFTHGAPTVSVTFDAASAALLAPLLAAAGLTIAQAQNMMASQVLDELVNNIHRFDLTPAIPVVNDADPTTVFNFDVTTINDTTVADRDCIVFGVRMSDETGGNINNATNNFIPAGSTSLVMMSNFWLLAHVMRPRVASALGLMTSDFDTPLRLNHNVPAPGGQGTLTNLEAFIEGNRIRVNGTATDSGTGWSAVSNFHFFIDLSVSGGAINVTASTPVVDTDVDLEWWVWLASLGLGALFGGIIGVIIAAIVLAIVEAVAEGIVNDLVSQGISGSLGNIPSLPLGPIGGGLSMSTLVLDDLELHCSILKSVSIPVKNHRLYNANAGFAADIDTGIISTVTNVHSDLIWNPSTGISTNGIARLTVINSVYGSITPVQISRLPLNNTQISLNSIPMSLPASFPFMPHSEIVFGARTSDGRLAKVRAFRNILNNGELEIEWTTYDTPIPQLDIAERWSIAERGDVTTYISSDCEYCTVSDVRWRGTFEAVAKLMAYPINYQWCLCGQILKDPEGEITTHEGTIFYKQNGKQLMIEATEIGQNIHCELCISGIDNRGLEEFTCIKLVRSGVDRKCTPCTKNKIKIPVNYLPVGKKTSNLRTAIAVEKFK